jgi:hypothetical protein
MAQYQSLLESFLHLVRAHFWIEAALALIAALFAIAAQASEATVQGAWLHHALGRTPARHAHATPAAARAQEAQIGWFSQATQECF